MGVIENNGAGKKDTPCAFALATLGLPSLTYSLPLFYKGYRFLEAQWHS